MGRESLAAILGEADHLTEHDATVFGLNTLEQRHDNVR